jgi:lipopolysaccharide/colanic/teichoic acid biosynthesis glycosyltransferase
MRNHVLNEVGQEVFEYIEKFVDLTAEETFVVSTTTIFNIEYHSSHKSHAIVNLRRVNDIRYLNKFFEAINAKLLEEGVFIGCAETKFLRKKRILAKYPPVINYLVYFLDFIIKRVFPKFPLLKKIYFFLTRGQNRVLTRAEILGRLYSCGFDVVDEVFINNIFYFVVKKVKEPVFDLNASYGPLVKLRRVGKDGKIIRVYKMRTMHPYAEYLQDYVYKMNNLEKGGKFKNDFRVSTVGKFMRTFWLDELPMFINLFKGDLKLVGVRPLSEHYFSLYSKELQEKRMKTKPGLIPPYYADMPKTLDEIMESELRYLDAYEKSPYLTDTRYFFKAVYNILIRKARSS